MGNEINTSLWHCVVFMYIGILIAHTVGSQASGDVALYRCSSFKKITGACKECNSPCRLPVIRSREDYDLIKKKMQDNHIMATWLGLRRIWLGEYLWLDCSKPFSNFLKENWTKDDPNCVTLRVELISSSRLEPWQCMSKRPSLCQIDGCASCRSVGIRKDCWKLGDLCFFLEHYKTDWERARVLCQKKGGILAILKEDLLKKVRELINPQVSSNYWVGLRRQEWTYPNMDLVPLRITTIHWDKNEPKQGGNCSIMINIAGQYVWRVSSCAAKYNALCIKPGEHVDLLKHGSRTSLKDSDPQNATSYIPVPRMNNVILAQTAHAGSNVLVILVGICAVVLVALLCLTIYKIYQDSSKRRLRGQNSLQEMDLLRGTGITKTDINS